MKPRLSNQRNQALTLTEVLIVVVALAIFVVLLLSGLAAAKRKSARIDCISNLKQIGLVYREWAGDNSDKFPMQVSATNGGAMELVTAGNVAAVFQVMSNELSTPKILVCPDDANQAPATNFTTDFNNNHISYFVNINVTNEINPQWLLSGDDNFEIGGVPVKSGLLEISSNAPISWSATRHHFAGNVLMADGSVQQFTTKGLQNALQQTGVTNRLAIP
ncbi:MAG TPA: type II secretion system protein [Verrucomicrobiae bacterium]|nr:type II secretion system protein [Verrucomicrobiae bacterium]